MFNVLYVADSLMAWGIEFQLVALTTNVDKMHIEPRVLSLYGPTVSTMHFAPALDAACVPYTTLDMGWTAPEKIAGIRGIVEAAHEFAPDVIQAEGYHANLLLRIAALLLPRR